MKKRIGCMLLVVAMIISLGAGCGTKQAAASVDTPEKAESKAEKPEKKEPEYTEEDLEGIVTGIEDHYILQNARDIDYTKGVEYDRDIVKGVEADTASVKLNKTGTYTITYTVIADKGKLTAYQKEKKAEKKDEGQKEEEKKEEEKQEDVQKEEGQEEEKTVQDTPSSSGEEKASGNKEASDSPDAEEEISIEIEKEIEVVDKEKGEELAGQGETVWTDGNKELPKDETEDKEKEGKIETPEGSGTTTPDAATPTEGGQGASSAQPVQPAQPAHTHSWVPQTATESYWVQDSEAWDEPVIENRTICNGCGADITGNADHIFWCDPGSYSVKPVQTGTIHHEGSGHWETRTVTTGYVCSGCGAVQ